MSENIYPNSICQSIDSYNELFPTALLRYYSIFSSLLGFILESQMFFLSPVLLNFVHLVQCKNFNGALHKVAI
jgi:hypothetical protein